VIKHHCQTHLARREEPEETAGASTSSTKAAFWVEFENPSARQNQKQPNPKLKNSKLGDDFDDSTRRRTAFSSMTQKCTVQM
jgi:hypothetical protein